MVYPGAEVDIVNGSPVARSIYGQFFFVRRIFELPAHAARHPLRTLRAVKAMRRVEYDLVIDPDPESQSGRLLTLLASATYSVGFASPKKSGRLTHEIVIPDEPRHKGIMPVFLLRAAIGEPATQRPYPKLDIQITPVESRQGQETLERLTRGQSIAIGSKGVIGVFAFATGRKNLGRDWWNRFLRVFEPAAADYSLVEILPAFGHSPLDCRYPGFFSSDVRKLGSVIANLSLYISADCGVMHLASAVGTPTVGVFTTTPLAEWGPYGQSNRAIDARGLAPEQVAVRILEMLGLQPIASAVEHPPIPLGRFALSASFQS